MFKTVSSKILFAIGTIFLFSFSASIYIGIWSQKRAFLKEAKKFSIILNLSIEKAIRNSMVLGRMEDVNKILTDLNHLKFIKNTYIVDVQGTIKSGLSLKKKSALTPEEKTILEEVASTNQTSVKLVGKGHNGYFLSAHPILNGPECFRCHNKNQKINGILITEVSGSDTFETISVNRNISIMEGVITIVLVTVTVILLLNYLLSQPITNLASAMKQVEKGNLKTRVQINSKDEFSHLGEKFNKMLHEIEEKNTEIEKMQKIILQREKLAALGQLAAGIAHEVNTPLTTILGCVDSILAEDVNDEEKKFLEILRGEIERISNTVTQLLALTRQYPLEKKLTNINKLIEEVITLIKPKALLQNIEIDYCPYPTPINIWLDPSLMKQVFLNISINAIHAMLQGGIFKILIQEISLQDENFIKIAFSDTGHGINKKNIDKIFDPFYTTKQQGEGSGIGLSTSYATVQEHKGKIEVESEEGKGATFTVFLPNPNGAEKKF